MATEINDSELLTQEPADGDKLIIVNEAGTSFLRIAWSWLKSFFVKVSDISTNIMDNADDDTKVASAKAVYDLVSQKADLVGGLVPANQLPSYVDDVLEFANFAALPGTGEAGKIYVTTDDNKTYRWSGSTYINITSPSLGEKKLWFRLNPATNNGQATAALISSDFTYLQSLSVIRFMAGGYYIDSEQLGNDYNFDRINLSSAAAGIGPGNVLYNVSVGRTNVSGTFYITIFFRNSTGGFIDTFPTQTHIKLDFAN